MTWKTSFDNGVACFKLGHLDDALAHMNQAAELQRDAFIVFDSRAAVHEKLGNLKAALLDSKRVIDLAPDRWQGYARSARLFGLAGKHGSAIKMADHALSLLRPEDGQRRSQLAGLREKVVAAQAAVKTQRQSHITKSAYFLGRLPVETLVSIFTVLIDMDHAWVVKLSHVCGHWRRILVNTPSAWQTLVLSKKHPLRKVKLWKQRARNRFTRLSFVVSELDRPSVLAELRDVSWDGLSALCTSGDAFLELHRMLSDISLPHAFSNLDELNLCHLCHADELSYCLSGPRWKLGILHLSGFVNIDNAWWQRIQQLREFHLSGQVRQFSLALFTANPSLERLVLSCPAMLVEHNVGSDAGPMPMDNLKHVECRDVYSPFEVLGAITAPSITHFRMSRAAFMVDETLLHTASRPSLVELRVANCCLSPSTLPTLLSSTPSLETLQVNTVHGIVNEMFRCLASRVADSLPCRALQHVDVSGCSDLTTSSVHAFVKVRTQYASESAGLSEKCAVITSLNADGCPHIEPDMLPWFRSKVAQFSCVYATKRDFKKDRRLRLQL